MAENPRRLPGKKSKKSCRLPAKNPRKTISADPLGSYTGRPTLTDRPVQDADDL